jgi:PA14 domain
VKRQQKVTVLVFVVLLAILAALLRACSCARGTGPTAGDALEGGSANGAAPDGGLPLAAASEAASVAPAASQHHAPTPAKGAPAIHGTNAFGSGQATPGALRGLVYFLPENTQKLPPLSTLEPTATVYTNELDISPRSFTEGFPGVHDRIEWFAVQYEGRFSVAADGTYGFRLNSDDGSKLFVDGKLVIDDDGIHNTRSVGGQAHLSQGSHAIRVDYYQGPRTGIALQLFVTPPGGAEAILRTPGPIGAHAAAAH